MENPKLPNRPFKKIALSCSGGGYRAAAFHLGSVSYLNRICYAGIPLLKNIEMLSTVSGGTIFGVFYAIGINENKDFEVIYTELRDKLSKLDLLKTGFSMLNAEYNWPNPYKSKNLINAFALQYDKEFTNGKTIGDLEKKEIHLKQMVFNSTEFNNGVNFRFKIGTSKHINKNQDYSGNYYIRIPKNLHTAIKLSDVMASSSCFPGGFEPLLWPKDFNYSVSDQKILQSDNARDIGLMDGGIYDNQGIESILNYKKGKGIYFDLVIISDVASPYMKPFEASILDVNPKNWKLLTLKKIKHRINSVNNCITYILSIVILLCGIYPVLYNFPNTIWTGVSITLFIVFTLLLFLKVTIVSFLKNEYRSYLSKLISGPFKFYAEKLKGFKIEELSIQMLEPLLINRIKSLTILLMDVFLKVTRRLNYDKLYENDQYKYRRISNLVRELTEFDYNNRLTREKIKASTRPHLLSVSGNYNDLIGKNIKSIAESAANFGTTLWFTEENKTEKMLDKLIASGQFTMCHNLIVYLEKLIYTKDSGFDELESNIKEEIKDLYNTCLKDWQKFKDHPMIMVDDLIFQH
ncbi:patatin-like phospholipase family protein [Flavobacterium soyae]|uniref:patatin-like phospholipase family protein n=1 Tax=Flavobacterium soyae TaxID=2903098 RepID=UPI001E2953FD|nr:patatin-like phospholipase family protein [Flavobacterium soyae]MCD9576246.1 patatin-like phospholipase family protein [Flavobacterium soyae]